MADLAGGENISLGYGIGLGAKLDYSPLSRAVAAGANERARAAALRAKAKEDEDKGWEKFAKDIKVSPNIDPIYENQVKQLVGKHVAMISDSYNKAPHNHPYNDAALLQNKGNMETEMAVINNNTQALKQFDSVKIPLMQSGNYDIDQENLKWFNKARELKDPSLFQNIKGPDGESVLQGGAINPTSLADAIFKPKPFNYQKAFVSSNITPVVVEKANQYPGGEFIHTSDNKVVDVQASKENLKAILSNQQDPMALGYLKEAKGDLDVAVDNAFNDYLHKAKVFTKYGLKNRTAGISDKDIEVAVKTKQEYNGTPDAAGTTRTYTAEGNAAFPEPINATLSNATGAIDAKTFDKVKDPGVIKAVSIGGLQNVPVDKETGGILGPEAVTYLKKSGHTDKMEYRTMAQASSTEKVPGPNGTETGETQSLLIPIDAVKTAASKKYSKLISAFDQERSKLNADLSTHHAKSTAPVAKKKDAKHYGL